MIRNIEIIGEAAGNIERFHADFAAQHPQVPCEDIYMMRNRVAHGYFSVDLDIVWKTISCGPGAMERKFHREANMTTRKRTKFVHEGGYVAEE